MTFISILVCLLFKTYIYIITSNELIADLWNVKSLIANFGLLFAGYSYFEMMGINNPVWYICVLFQCYLLYYFAEWLIEKFRCDKNIKYFKFFVYITICLLTLATFYFGILNEATFRGFASFFIGLIICIINEELRKRFLINERNINIVGYILFSIALLSGVLILFGLNQRWVLQFLVFPFLVWSFVNINLQEIKIISKLGCISFELYVIHYPLMVLLQLISLSFDISFCHSYRSMILFLLFAWVIAYIMWKFIELPVNKKIRNFEKRFL